MGQDAGACAAEGVALVKGQPRRQKNSALSKDEARDLAFDKGYRLGFKDAQGHTIKMTFAAVCLVLNRRYGFGQKRCYDVLTDIDKEMSPNGQLTVRGAIDEVYEKIGLRLTFDDPFDPVEMVNKKEQDK